jgi:hypothetical protein
MVDEDESSEENNNNNNKSKLLKNIKPSLFRGCKSATSWLCKQFIVDHFVDNFLSKLNMNTVFGTVLSC